MKTWIQTKVMGAVENIVALRNLPPAERQCCADKWSSDAWDPTPASCLGISPRCTLFAPVPDAFEPEPQTQLTFLASSQPDSQVALFIFCFAICLGVAVLFFCRTVRGLWKAYDCLDVTIDFDVDSAPSIYPLVLTIASAIPAAGVSRTELEVLEDGLRARGFGLKDIASDGNCFYRSVAHHALGDEEWHAHIRECAVDELRADPCRYRAFTTEDYDTYVDNMAENAVWGSQLEAFALSKRLGRPIKIWQANTATGDVTSFSHKTTTGDAADGSDDNIIDIAFFDRAKHYFAVVPSPAGSVHDAVHDAGQKAEEEEEEEEEEEKKPREGCSAAEERACERGKEEGEVEEGGG